jgi:hypothetical protein
VDDSSDHPLPPLVHGVVTEEQVWGLERGEGTAHVIEDSQSLDV